MPGACSIELTEVMKKHNRLHFKNCVYINDIQMYSMFLWGEEIGKIAHQ